MPWLEELLRDRERMMKLVWIAVWAGIAFMVIGYLLMAQDLLG